MALRTIAMIFAWRFCERQRKSKEDNLQPILKTA